MENLSDATAIEAASLNSKAKGNDSYKQGNIQEAIAHFTDAIELDCSNSTFFCNRALCYYSMKDWAKCVDDAIRAIKLSK